MADAIALGLLGLVDLCIAALAVRRGEFSLFAMAVGIGITIVAMSAVLLAEGMLHG